MDDLCSAIASVWREKVAAQNIEIVCKAASQSIVTADRGQLLQVLDNLMENAVHSVSSCRPEGGVVTISTTTEHGFVCASITDNGRGFTPAALRHAIDPFYTAKDNGTGLGLSISFEILQAHGGELRLSNHDGGGAKAKLRMPLNKVERTPRGQTDEGAEADV